MAGRDVQRVGAGLRRPQRDLLAFGVLQPFREIVVDREPVDHRDLHRRLAGAQHLKADARAVFELAAVLVGAAVLERREELRDQVAVRGMDLDARRSRPSRARAAAAAKACTVLRMSITVIARGTMVSLVDLVNRMRNGRGRDRRLAADVEAGVAAAVAELDRALAAAAMDFSERAG